MVFSSFIFLFLFLPFVLFGNYVLKNIKTQNVFLLISSLLFYIWGEGHLVVLVILSALINYITGYLIAEQKNKKLFLIIGITLNLGLLFYYKYFAFIVSNINSLGLAHLKESTIILPIGISFFTFHGLSYIIDIYRNNQLVQKNFTKLLLYITFFPQLVAGPIVRYYDIESQLTDRKITFDKTIEGIKRFIIGLAKKVLIANVMGVLFVKIMNDDIHLLGAGAAWLAMIAFALQVYFDFSGYSDMAIGLAKMFGFTFLENFNYPFISRSIKEFWQRWHISLSNWFKDYLYIPLGGSRKGKLVLYRNILIVFFITGLWHGAEWRFIAWGCFNGIFIVLEKIFFEKHLNKYKIISHFYFLIVILISFVFQNINGMDNVIHYLKNMFFLNNNENTMSIFNYLSKEESVIGLIGILLSLPLKDYIIIKSNGANQLLEVLKMFFLIVIFSLSIISLASNTFNPFIYFRF